MSVPYERPVAVQINGWSSDTDNTAALPARTPIALKRVIETANWRGLHLAPALKADNRDWRNTRVGWGLVLPDDDKLSAVQKARAEDASPSLRRLLNARSGSPVLRWAMAQGNYFLRRYYEDGSAEDLDVATPRFGVDKGCIPRYLLIYATPTQIPWSLQFILNMEFCVGRLDLGEDEGLANYIDALINNWQGAGSDPRSPLIWAVDHGKPDITWLMARAIASRLFNAYKADADLTGRVYLRDQAATGAALVSTLIERRPALIVTSSHGSTGPLSDKQRLIEQLGIPVDREHQPLSVSALTTWKPAGAIWYAQACCSAGANNSSRYIGLVNEDTGVGQILSGISAMAGACIAPLPRKLLGCSTPLRAFIGHVEPTFDWTLRNPENGEVVTAAITDALYTDLYQQDKFPMTIGEALRKVFSEAGGYFSKWEVARREVDQNLPKSRERALYCQLVAMDRQSLVILGDPTVTLPPL